MLKLFLNELISQGHCSMQLLCLFVTDFTKRLRFFYRDSKICSRHVVIIDLLMFRFTFVVLFLLSYFEISFAFSALTLMVGQQEGHQACKNWVVGCWHGCLSGARCRLANGQLIPLPPTVSCFAKIQIGFALLVPAHAGTSPLVLNKGPLNARAKRARARARVCVCAHVVFSNVLSLLFSDNWSRIKMPSFLQPAVS